MATKPKQYSESHAIAVIDEALSSLTDDEARGRVLDWANAKHGVAPTNQRGRGQGAAMNPGGESPAMDADVGPKAKAWVKKHGITSQLLENAFHIDGETSTLIVKAVRGGSKRERVRQVAALLGAMALVKTDQAKFTAAEFREALKQYDAYDGANNTAYVKGHKDVIQGSASTGYTVTSVGLDLAATALAGVPSE